MGKLEKVQRRVTKFILKTEDCYVSRLKKLNLLSMEKRRLLTDVSFIYIYIYIYIYKAVYGLIDSDRERYVDFYKETDHHSSFRHNDELALKMRYGRTNILGYFHRFVGTWNSLPEYIRRAASVNSF